MYRVELCEMTEKYGEIARISSPVMRNNTIMSLVNKFINIYDDEIKKGKYYIKIIYINIKD